MFALDRAAIIRELDLARDALRIAELRLVEATNTENPRVLRPGHTTGEMALSEVRDALKTVGHALSLMIL